MPVASMQGSEPLYRKDTLFDMTRGLVAQREAQIQQSVLGSHTSRVMAKLDKIETSLTHVTSVLQQLSAHQTTLQTQMQEQKLALTDINSTLHPWRSGQGDGLSNPGQFNNYTR